MMKKLASIALALVAINGCCSVKPVVMKAEEPKPVALGPVAEPEPLVIAPAPLVLKEEEQTPVAPVQSTEEKAAEEKEKYERAVSLFMGLLFCVIAVTSVLFAAFRRHREEQKQLPLVEKTEPASDAGDKQV